MLRVSVSYGRKSLFDVIGDCGLSELGFINAECIREKKKLASPLSDEDNEALSRLLFSLGKSDVNSQLTLIDGFKEYIKIKEEQYREEYDKNSRLYLAFGLFSGLVISVLIL